MTDGRMTAEEYAIQWLEANGLRESPLPDLILSVMVLDELTAKFKSYGDQRAAEERKAAPQQRPCGHYVKASASFCKACHEIVEARKAALDQAATYFDEVAAGDETMALAAQQYARHICSLAASPASEEK